ncbi:MAG TPA: LysM domain-containing protein [Thermoleophilaceae bacterium]
MALALCTVALFYVVISSGSSDESGGGSSSVSRTETSQRSRTNTTTTGTGRRTYTVKTGDTLGGISAKTGVPVEKLQELNPGLDPQALVSGQRIKLRE